MSEQTQDKTTAEPSDNENAVEYRRRLLKASLSAGAFPALMSLASRPLACATGGKKTTRPSGFCSMKMATSYHGKKCDAKGCSPEHWLATTTWPSNCKRDTIDQKTGKVVTGTKCSMMGLSYTYYDGKSLHEVLSSGPEFHKWCVAAYLSACSSATAEAVCSKDDVKAMWEGCGNGASGYKPYAGSKGWTQSDCVSFLKSTTTGI